MTPLDVKMVGPLRMRLLEKESPVEPTFFAARYYLDVRHADAPDFTAITYLGHDRAHAGRQFVRRVDNAQAKQEADHDDGR